jgi:hypothetical protein
MSLLDNKMNKIIIKHWMLTFSSLSAFLLSLFILFSCSIVFASIVPPVAFWHGAGLVTFLVTSKF